MNKEGLDLALAVDAQPVQWVTPEVIKFDKHDRNHWLAMKQLAEDMLADLAKEKVTIKQAISNYEGTTVTITGVESTPMRALEYPFYIPFELTD